MQLIDTCLTLDEAQLAFAADGTFGSIAATLGHIVFAEERYIFHISGGAQAAGTQRPSEVTTLNDLRARAVASGASLLQLATTIDGGVRVRVGKDAFPISIEALLLQAIHHAHEHRTHVETMLGQLGMDPPGLSGWRYFDEQIGE